MSYDHIEAPDDGPKITLADEETGELDVSEDPITRFSTVTEPVSMSVLSHRKVQADARR